VTVLAAYLPEKGGRATLQLGAVLARGLGVGLAVATVVPKPWDTEAPTPGDEGFRSWSQRLAATAAASARAHLAQVAPDVGVEVHHRVGRSVSAALVELAADLGAATLVLGSSADGQLGQVVVGSTADRLLHSSPVPLALAPRGYREPAAPPGGGGSRLARVTFAASGRRDADGVARAQALAAGLGVPLRVVSLAVRGRTTVPAANGPGAEDEVLAAWGEVARAGLESLRATGVLAADVPTEVVGGRGWREAVDAVEWVPGDLLVVGTRPAGPVARVFLGSHATKILRHSPVPVVVLPG